MGSDNYGAAIIRGWSRGTIEPTEAKGLRDLVVAQPVAEKVHDRCDRGVGPRRERHDRSNVSAHFGIGDAIRGSQRDRGMPFERVGYLGEVDLVGGDSR